MRLILLMVSLLLLPAVSSAASASDAYNEALGLAGAGHAGEAAARLDGAAAVLPDESIWRERMTLAAAMIRMRSQQQSVLPPLPHPGSNAALAKAYLQATPLPQAGSSWVVNVLAVVLPGSGHAWLGRWHDALTAALLVWPMLLLTLWAGYRRMGPVTVFFALITAWLWSGTVFSAMSLAERGSYEDYLLWWQGLWQASALPGRPW